MSTVSRGFKGRRRPTAKLPPGQYLVQDFPGAVGRPDPTLDLGDWEPGFWERLGYHNHGDPWQEQRFWGD